MRLETGIFVDNNVLSPQSGIAELQKKCHSEKPEATRNLEVSRVEVEPPTEVQPLQGKISLPNYRVRNDKRNDILKLPVREDINRSKSMDSRIKSGNDDTRSYRFDIQPSLYCYL